MYRIVICLDVAATSMKEAYHRVYKKMKMVDCDDLPKRIQTENEHATHVYPECG